MHVNNKNNRSFSVEVERLNPRRTTFVEQLIKVDKCLLISHALEII